MADGIWTDEFLDEMTRTGDPLGDDTVQVIYDHHQVRQVNSLLQDLIEHGEVVLPPDLHPDVVAALTHYLDIGGRLPSWADSQRIAQGEELLRQHGMAAFSLLGCASLPEVYTCGKGLTPVLGTTQELEAHVARRIPETAQFVIDVVSQDGLRPGGKGIRAAQRLRLMHAAIRFLMKTDPGDHPGGSGGDTGRPTTLGEVLTAHRRWNPEWGEPIGQEYLAITLLTFSYVILRSLRNLGIKTPREQEEDYLHCWNVAGYLLGIDERFLLNVNTMDQAEALFTRIRSRKRSQTDAEKAEGWRLTRAVLNYMGAQVERRLWRVDPARHIPRILLVTLVGEDTAHLLGVRLDWIDRLARVFLRFWKRWLADVEHGFTADRRLAEWLFRRLVEEWTQMLRGGRRKPFELPAHLVASWRLRQIDRRGTPAASAPRRRRLLPRMRGRA